MTFLAAALIHQFAVPPTVHKGFIFLHIVTNACYLLLFESSRTICCDVASCFDLPFSWLVILSLFSYINWPSVCLHEEMLFHVLCVFLIRLFNIVLLNYRVPDLFLDINPLSDISFSNLFSHLVGCFCFIECFLCCAEGFDEVLFVYFCSCFPCVMGNIQNDLAQTNSNWFSTSFPSPSQPQEIYCFRPYI